MKSLPAPTRARPPTSILPSDCTVMQVANAEANPKFVKRWPAAAKLVSSPPAANRKRLSRFSIAVQPARFKELDFAWTLDALELFSSIAHPHSHAGYSLHPIPFAQRRAIEMYDMNF